MQIRGGLHVLGRAPEGDALNDLLVSMVRLPRGDTEPADASLTRALAADLDLGEFDPCPRTRWLGAVPPRWRGCPSPTRLGVPGSAGVPPARTIAGPADRPFRASGPGASLPPHGGGGGCPRSRERLMRRVPMRQGRQPIGHADLASRRGAPAATRSSGWSSWPRKLIEGTAAAPSPGGAAPARYWSSSSATCARGSSPRVRPSSTRAGTPLTRGSCRRAPRARRPGAASTSCPRAGTSTPSTPAPCRHRRPGSSAGSRRRSCWSATARSTGRGRNASRSPRGAPRTCAPAATTSRRRSRSWG